MLKLTHSAAQFGQEKNSLQGQLQNAEQSLSAYKNQLEQSQQETSHALRSLQDSQAQRELENAIQASAIDSQAAELSRLRVANDGLSQELEALTGELESRSQEWQVSLADRDRRLEEERKEGEARCQQLVRSA